MQPGRAGKRKTSDYCWSSVFNCPVREHPLSCTWSHTLLHQTTAEAGRTKERSLKPGLDYCDATINTHSWFKNELIWEKHERRWKVRMELTASAGVHSMSSKFLTFSSPRVRLTFSTLLLGLNPEGWEALSQYPFRSYSPNLQQLRAQAVQDSEWDSSLTDHRCPEFPDRWLARGLPPTTICMQPMN